MVHFSGATIGHDDDFCDNRGKKFSNNHPIAENAVMSQYYYSLALFSVGVCFCLALARSNLLATALSDPCIIPGKVLIMCADTFGLMADAFG